LASNTAPSNRECERRLAPAQRHDVEVSERWQTTVVPLGAIIWTYGKSKGCEGHLTKARHRELRTRRTAQFLHNVLDAAVDRSHTGGRFNEKPGAL
jgi:hypothetical protein